MVTGLIRSLLFQWTTHLRRIGAALTEAGIVHCRLVILEVLLPRILLMTLLCSDQL